MKILSVSICNLNSLRGAHFVDLEAAPLKNSGLFLISGKTGAGKTTILDAITLAIYGQVARNPKKGSHPEVLTHGEKECYAEVTFRVFGQEYRARWTHEKKLVNARKGNENYYRDEVRRSISLIDGTILASAKETDVSKKIDEILQGLSLEQFLRSIMLAQGEFAQLLKEDKTKRGEILERITDMGIYTELSKAAFQRDKQAKNELKELEDRIQQHFAQMISAEQYSQYEVQKQEIGENIDRENQELDSLQKNIRQLRQAEKLAIEQEKAALEVEQKTTALADVSPLLAQIERHKKAEPLAALLQKQTEETAQLEKTRAELLQNNQQITAQQAAQKTSHAAAEKANHALEQWQETYPARKQIWDEVSRIDMQAEQARHNAKDNQKELDELQKQSSEAKKTLATLQQELAALHQKEQQNNRWFEANSSLIPSNPENINAQKINLERHEDITKNIARLQKELATVRKQQAENDEEQNKTFDKYELANQEVQKLKSQYEGFVKKYSLSWDDYQLNNLQSIEQRINRSSDFLHAIEQTIAIQQRNEEHHQKILAHEEQQKKCIATLDSQKQAIANLHAEEAILVQQIKQINEEITALQKKYKLQHFLQEAAAYRAENLKLGDSCPICTQTCTHLPNAEHKTIFAESIEEQQNKENELSQARQNLDELREKIAAQGRQIQDTAAKINQSQRDIAQEETTITQNHRQIAKIIANWQINISIEDNSISTLIDQETIFKAERQGLETFLNKDAERWRVNYRNQSDKVIDYNKAIQKLKNEKTNLLQKESDSSGELKKQELNAQTLVESITDFLKIYKLPTTPKDWLPSLLLLENNYKTFKTHDSEKEKIKQEKFLNENRQQIQDEKLNELLKNEQQKAAKLDDAKKQLADLQAQRAKLLPADVQPAQEEAKFNQKAQTLKNEAQQQQQLLSKITAEIAQLQGYVQAQTAQELNSQANLQNINAQLLATCQNIGIASPALAQAWLLPKNTLDNLQAEIAQAEKNLAQAQQQQQFIREQAAALPVANAEILQSQSEYAEKLKTNIENQRNELARIQAQIEIYLQNQERFKNFDQERNAKKEEVQEWAELNLLIGAADGKKFREFAQSITLRRLVQLANLHLRKFISGRYRLGQDTSKDGSQMDLVIIDCFQADNARSLHSLSGGETFLASLALALALADLAGSKIQFESLFIDEGFGSLDTETLQIAIDVLQTLQNQGKTIGIISHVDMLQQSIPNQIQVLPNGGGFSRLVVKGS